MVSGEAVQEGMPASPSAAPLPSRDGEGARLDYQAPTVLRRVVLLHLA